MIRLLAAIAAVLVLCTSGAAAAAPAKRALLRQVMVASGPMAAVTTEYGYNAFPVVAVSNGRVIAMYGSATTHDGPLSDWTIRRSTDGAVWSDPTIVPMPLSGYSYGPGGGLDVETATQGGRIYATIQRAHWPATGGSHPDEQRYWLYTSDDDAASWQQRGQFPTTPGTWGFGPSNLLVEQGGNITIGGYSSDGVVRFMTSTDRGLTMASTGSVTVTGRSNGSPQLGQLSDGRVFAVFRSDATGTNSRYYYTWRTGTSSWSTPALLFGDATTIGGLTVINDDTIAIAYRSWADRTDDGPQYRPLRYMFAGVNGNVMSVWKSNHDLAPYMRSRYLGGKAVQLASGDWVVIWGIEGPLTTATAAAIVALPVRWAAAA